MKDPANKSGRAAAGRPGFVSVCLFSGAFLGLLIGLVEAAMLWTTPRVIPLLVPDVGWVIWVLAPLVDMLFFALVGLGLGLLASRTRHKEVPVAVGGGIAITFVYLMVKWFHVKIGLHPFYPTMELLAPLVTFFVAFVVSLILLVLFWRRLAGFADRWLNKLLKLLTWGVAAATVAAVLGIGVFFIWPLTSGPAAPTAAPPPKGAPNIVFITLDTVRADHLSSYGYSRPTTPNIDRFARTGVLFENAIAPTSWTLASHASMFTGLLPQQHGADWAVPLTRSPSTLAEILRSRGYQTVSFVANQLYLQKGWGIGQGFEIYGDQRFSLLHNLAMTFVGSAAVQPAYQDFDQFDYVDRERGARLNERVFQWLHHRVRHPYFLFVNYFDAHAPYLPPRPFDRLYGKASGNLTRRFVETLLTRGSDAVKLRTGERQHLVDAYDNCLAYLDSQVGHLLKSLRQSPQWQNTIVIMTSDHGEEFGQHGFFSHGANLYRAALHVPLIVAGPGVPNGVRISHLVGTRQLFSTVLDMAGHGQTPFSRSSLARFWDPGFKPGPIDGAVVSELVPADDLKGQRASISLTTLKWQYIAHRDGRQELYNWLADPREQVNLAAAHGERATLKELRSRLINLVSNATGPWHGPEYLQALDSIAKGPARLSLLHPRALQPHRAVKRFRIGTAQAYFKSDESTPIRPSKSEQELMQSLPYQ